MINPLANRAQFDAEADVRAMWEMPSIQAARATAAELFRLAYGTDSPPEALPEFDDAIDEYVTNYLFKAAASDAAHPRFVRDFMPSYDWNGAAVPAARMGGDNPDNCYRLAGIVHGGRYRVIARPSGTEPANTSFTLTGNYGTSVTIQTIENWQLTREPDGSFVITIDDQPANGRRNHLTTAPHVKFLFVRESFGDWAAEASYEFAIERLDRVDVPPLAIEQMAERAAFRLVEDVPLYYWFQRLFSGVARNSIRPPLDSARLGGLVTQAGVQGHFVLGEDDAVLIRLNPAGGRYVAVSLVDWWFRSMDAHKTQSSLTQHDMARDPDGWLSVVIARRDPGIANWLDSGGRATSLFLARWQALPAEPVAGGPQITSEIMAIDRLPRALMETQPIDPATRALRLAGRQAAWNRRVNI
ncbi:MAG: hypothetical protein JOY99_05975 [Sphingomonadaceae bacterium]|nr:hypothetical protein [Sphingomonadaceae bacterium]